jgi:hypothetical protein
MKDQGSLQLMMLSRKKLKLEYLINVGFCLEDSNNFLYPASALCLRGNFKGLKMNIFLHWSSATKPYTFHGLKYN